MSTFSAAPALQLLMNAAMGQDCALCLGRAGAGLVCAACAESLPHDELESPGVSAAFAYRFPVDRLVQRFKFSGDLAIGRWLASALAEHVRGEPVPDLLVAPPLTAARLRERGFNQSVEIARVVGRALGIPHARHGVRKVRETTPQQGLGRGARQANLRGAFECDLALDGMRVAIVDDVLTTGATAAHLAGALRVAGAREVAVWAVARAPRAGR
jgi:ComF family protein